MSGLDKSRDSFSSWVFETMPTDAAEIKLSVNFLSALLLKNRTLQCGIMQITDVGEIDTLIARVRNNNGIYIHSKRQRRGYLAALDAYKEYLTFLHSDASDQVAREDTVTDTEYVLPDTSNEDLYVSFISMNITL